MLFKCRRKLCKRFTLALALLCGVFWVINQTLHRRRLKNSGEAASPKDVKPCPTLKIEERSHLYYNGEAAVSQTDFDMLYRQMLGVAEYSWMLKRMKRMEPLWLAAVKSEFPSPEPFRIKKRIHVHPGLLAWGLSKHAGRGAPVGELVQWSDILSSLHILGHDVVLSYNLREAKELYQDCIDSFGCLNRTALIPFDLVYIDIIGYKEVLMKLFLDEKLPEAVKCRVRVVDSWGTEADFNVQEVAYRKGRGVSFYGGLELNLKQFNTLYPHSPDNTFLGFVIETVVESSEEEELPKRDVALLYAKTHDLLDDKYHYIDLIKEYFPEVHATIGGPWKKKPQYVTNHNVLSQTDFSKLLRRTKIFVGFGKPFEGPGALEAIQLGAIFLNRKIELLLGKKKPTARVLTSQNTYAQRIGPPHVYTLDVDDDNEVRRVLSTVANSPDPGGYLTFEFSARGMLQRVVALVENQDFCTPVRWGWNDQVVANYCSTVWPPLASMKATVISGLEESCSDACERNGYICEPSFFPVLNRREAFSQIGGDTNTSWCAEFKTPAKGEIEFPAFDAANHACYLQSNELLFSCARNELRHRRLCPCRDYIPQQVALCRDCILIANEQNVSSQLAR